MSSTAIALGGIAGMLLVAVLLLAIGPIFTIWSVNLLFGFAIPVTFKTWLCTAWLGMQFGGMRLHTAFKEVK